MFRTLAALTLVTLTSTVPAFAAEAESKSLAAEAATAALAADTDWTMPAVQLGQKSDASRGALLPSLYVTLAALNLYDGYSTHAGVSHGATEANPIMGGLANTSAGLFAAKGVATATTIFLSEKLWKQHHRAAAVAVMVISNGMMAAVAAHNTSVLHSVR